MSRITSLVPMASSRFGYAQAAHLLGRAGFGGSRQQIEALLGMGLAGAVDYLVDYETVAPNAFTPPEYDPDIIRPYTDEERKEMRAERNDPGARERRQAERNYRQELDGQQMNELEKWWLSTLIASPRPLEEKLTLLWHGHFASNYRGVRDSYLMLKQNQFFRTNANGSFAELALGIVKDPAMIKFLNNDTNRKANPNENLARELMELFTLGEGNYTEEDIKEGARALTGSTYEDNEYVFKTRDFDNADKSILGQAGNWNAEGFVRILLKRPGCPIFVASKLYRHFVADVDETYNPADKAIVTAMSSMLKSNRYELKPVLKALFRSQMFYSEQVMGNQIKSPAQVLVGTIRTLDTPVHDISLLQDAMGMMGQKLFNPPSVAGWYGGRSWVNTSTLFVRQNLGTYLVTGKLPFNDGWSTHKMAYDPTPLIAGLKQPTPVNIVDHLLPTLCAAKLAPQRREQLVTFMNGRKNPTERDALVGLLLLITALPEYQLC